MIITFSETCNGDFGVDAIHKKYWQAISDASASLVADGIPTDDISKVESKLRAMLSLDDKTYFPREPTFPTQLKMQEVEKIVRSRGKEGITIHEICEKTGYPHNTLSNVLSRLVSLDAVVCTKRSNERGRPTKIYNISGRRLKALKDLTPDDD